MAPVVHHPPTTQVRAKRVVKITALKQVIHVALIVLNGVARIRFMLWVAYMFRADGADRTTGALRDWRNRFQSGYRADLPWQGPSGADLQVDPPLRRK